MYKAILMILALGFGQSARADQAADQAGDFDYYVMSLGWSSNWCALTGDARRDPQCDTGRGFTWTLHGLWPQYENGFPSYCRTTAADPPRRLTESMADIMGGAGLAFYQWKKHGRCAGLNAPDYFALMRRAYDSVTIPPLFFELTQDLRVPALVIEQAFLENNPQLDRDQITITCKAGMIQGTRICLTRDLEPRRCGADVIRDCTLQAAALDALR